MDYGSELTSLTGCQQMAVDAEELSRWHDCLRENADRKATEITAALQHSASRVSRLVCWLLMSLNNTRFSSSSSS